jgi:hypothetical protein
MSISLILLHKSVETRCEYLFTLFVLEVKL